MESSQAVAGGAVGAVDAEQLSAQLAIMRQMTQQAQQNQHITQQLAHMVSRQDLEGIRDGAAAEIRSVAAAEAKIRRVEREKDQSRVGQLERQVSAISDEIRMIARHNRETFPVVARVPKPPVEASNRASSQSRNGGQPSHQQEGGQPNDSSAGATAKGPPG